VSLVGKREERGFLLGLSTKTSSPRLVVLMKIRTRGEAWKRKG